MSDPVIQSNLLVKISQLVRDDTTISNVNLMATPTVANYLLPVANYYANYYLGNQDTTVTIEIQDKNVNNL